MSGIIIRDFEELTIVIEDRNTIWALPKHSMPNVIFHRWFGPLGTFENWRRFRERMRANKNITLADCYRLANRWQVQTQGTTRRPEALKHATLARKGKQCSQASKSNTSHSNN